MDFETITTANGLKNLADGSICTLALSAPNLSMDQPISTDKATRALPPELIFDDRDKPKVWLYRGVEDYIEHIAANWEIGGVISGPDKQALISAAKGISGKKKSIQVKTALGKEKLSLQVPINLQEVARLNKRARVYRSFFAVVEKKLVGALGISKEDDPNTYKNKVDVLNRRLKDILELLTIDNPQIFRDSNGKYIFTADVAEFFAFLLVRFDSAELGCYPKDFDFTTLPDADKFKLLQLYFRALESLEVDDNRRLKSQERLISRLGALPHSSAVSSLVHECIAESAKKVRITQEEFIDRTRVTIILLEGSYQTYLKCFKDYAIALLDSTIQKSFKPDGSFGTENEL